MPPVRIGVVGCGAIAQVQHLPNLLELEEQFEVVIVCDLSPDQAEYAAGRFRIPRHTSKLEEVLAADIDEAVARIEASVAKAEAKLAKEEEAKRKKEERKEAERKRQEAKDRLAELLHRKRATATLKPG